MDENLRAAKIGLNPGALFDNTEEIVRRARLAVSEALRDHQIAGNPVAIWQTDRVTIVAPGEILPETCDKKSGAILETG